MVRIGLALLLILSSVGVAASIAAADSGLRVDTVSDITFDVNKLVAGAAPAGDLPAAEPIDTSASPLTFVSSSQLPLVAGVAIAFWSILALALFARQRRLAPARTI